MLTACVSAGKHKKFVALADASAARQADKIHRLQDSLAGLQLALVRSEGSNEALLASQDKYLRRLSEQEEDLDQMRGNLTSTSTQLKQELAATQEALTAARGMTDSLRGGQQALVSEFRGAATAAVKVLRQALAGKVDSLQYTLEASNGAATLSVQEDLLFRTGTVDRLTAAAPEILRAVIDALQSNPLLKLTVVGHTDSEPNPRRNTDNWQYAALRATHLATELAETYYLSPNRVLAASQGAFTPLTSNATAEGRRRNRRVDFVLRNNTGNLLRNLEKLADSTDN